MARESEEQQSMRRRGRLTGIVLAGLNLIIAIAAIWLGMSVPAYFRSVSPLVLEAAAENTNRLPTTIERYLQAGRPGMALPLIQSLKDLDSKDIDASWESRCEELLQAAPLYRWSGGPAPYYETFLKQARYKREDAPEVLPTLLPAAHRQQLRGFLEESPNQLVHLILATSELNGWLRFYPVGSTSGHPLEATLLTMALLEQASALSTGLREDLIAAIDAAQAPAPSIEELEKIYIGILTLGTHAKWVQLKTLTLATDSSNELLQVTQWTQDAANNLARITALLELYPDSEKLCAYLQKHGLRGWDSLQTTLPLGAGATEALINYDRPVYIPPALWTHLPQALQNGQAAFKHFAESLPVMAMGLRAAAFFLCGFSLVNLFRCLIVRTRFRDRRRRLLLNLDTSIGGVLVMLLLWVMIEPGLLDFRPNEEGVLQIRLAAIGADIAESSPPQTPETMIDQVTLLILVLFFLIQLLVFVYGLLKISEVRRREVSPEIKLRLLDNEENLFDLGLYVGLAGTVSSLILVVLNIVDASLMAAYASTLFGIIFVALLKVGFIRPYRRALILSNS
jgi:hypothetical protein